MLTQYITHNQCIIFMHTRYYTHKMLIPQTDIKAQVLPARSGVIQAALVLELQSKFNSFFTVKVGQGELL